MSTENAVVAQPTLGGPPALPLVENMDQAAETVAKIAMLDSQAQEIEQTAQSQIARTSAWKRREMDAITDERARLVASIEPWALAEIERQEKVRKRSSVPLPWGEVALRHSSNAGLVVTDETEAADALQELLPSAVRRSVLVTEVRKHQLSKTNPEGRVRITEGRVFVDGEMVPGIEWRDAGPRVVRVSARDTPLAQGDG